MDPLLQALLGFLVGAIPTIILFLLLWTAYKFLVHAPLKRVLQERYERTQGALERARRDIATAEAKTGEYEGKLREAKLGIFKAQEAARQQLLAQRDAAEDEARQQSHQLLQQAHKSLDSELATAKAGLERQADDLAARVIRSVLRPTAAAPAGGAR